MAPVAATRNVREDELHLGVTSREFDEFDGIGRFLSRPLPASMLPDVMQHGEALLAGGFADGIQETVVGPPAGRQLHPDESLGPAARDLGQGVMRVVRVDAHVTVDRASAIRN